MFKVRYLQEKLQRAPSSVVSLYAGLAAFGTYSGMYAFRKPFTAATFDHFSFIHIDYKIWLITAQLAGYTASKFYGIRFIAEVKGNNRGRSIIVLILTAWIALLFFALTPPPFNIVFLLINGFPLGMVWGLVFAYLEGRKTTEFMGALLCTSFIFSSGFVKSVGSYLMLSWGVTMWWMPFMTGLIFLLPVIFFVILLEQVPPPTVEDEYLRTRREPMNKKDRRQLVLEFLPGLILLIGVYIMLTVVRDLRDNFASNIWDELGYGKDPSIFTATEIPVSLAVLGCVSLLVWVKNNFRALLINHYLVIAGLLVAGLGTYLFREHYLGPVTWVTLTGLGLYLGYVPFNCIFFDRLIATFKHTANVGFIMYLADSCGYLGSIAVLIVKNFSGVNISWSLFFMRVVIFVSLAGIILTLASMLYFKRKYRRRHISPAVPRQGLRIFA